MKRMFAPVLEVCALSVVAGLVLGGCVSAPVPVPVPVPVSGPAEPLSGEAREVAAVLDAMERSLEDHDLAGVLRQVSVYYRDGRGNDYMQLEKFLERMLSEYVTIDIERSETRVTVRNTHAEVCERFVTRATPRAGAGVPAIDQDGPVVIRLERVAGDWLVAEWATAAER